MEIMERLISGVSDGEVKAVHVGFFTTAVVSSLSGGRVSCGLASTIRTSECLEPVKFAGSMRGLQIKELARLALSNNSLEASIGLAAVNSALPECGYEEGNAEELIAQKAGGNRVAIIGHFPFTQRIRESAKELWVFELEPKDEKDLPPEKMPELLSRADIIAVTAMTLINHTFESIVFRCRKGSFKILLGPSAPLSPVLFEYGVDIIAGTKVTDAPVLIRHLSEGSNFRSLPGKKLVIMRKPRKL